MRCDGGEGAATAADGAIEERAAAMAGAREKKDDLMSFLFFFSDYDLMS
jgi:hypothetical protein